MQKPARSAYLVLVLLAIILVVPMLGLSLVTVSESFEQESSSFWRSTYLRRVLVFSFSQAFLSTLLSVGLALLVARAMARRGNFLFRNLLLKLFALPLVVPAVVAVLGVVSVYGSNGWIPLGRDLYGLNGILLAHLFFNLPLAVRLLLPVWFSIPRPYWRLSEQLGMNSWQQWRLLEWPALRESLPGVAILVFMLCLTSFAVVLTLGGGPKSTTLEVAIYQSLRFDFDPVRAVILALLQFTLCATVAIASLGFQKLPEVEIGYLSQDLPSTEKGRIINMVIILLAALFVGTPILSMLIDAARGPVLAVLSNPGLWQAAGHSLTIGLSAATLSVSMAYLLLRSSADLFYLHRTNSAMFIELAGSLVYVVPPLVTGTGLFVLLSPYVDVFDWAIPIVVLINAMMGLPFAIRTISPTMRQNKKRYQRLCEALDLNGWHRFKIVDWPLLRKPFGMAMALIAALALGDLGVIALFGTPQSTTLPLLLYQQLGAYLMDQAAVSAAFLLFLCLLIFWLLERLIGGRGYA
ncbi:MAG: thiamine/thiamine pyrophosphate ABC transporter, permease protein [Gammaproteobacteria bacterium]|nr:thiamine/thiamine pyrophosphate ABC transporter, permease protein [Gammaproteobacteria bacterium]